MIVCSTVSDNSMKQVLKLKEKFKCELLICKNVKLEDIVNKENCKLAVIKDRNLAKAILNSLNDNLIKYCGGIN